MFTFNKNTLVAAATLFNTNAVVEAYNGYTGAFSLKPEEDCQGICMCMGDQDMSALATGGGANGGSGEKLNWFWTKAFSLPVYQVKL